MPGKKSPITKERLDFYREAELKHGRVGMMATLGFFVTEGLGYPPASLCKISAIFLTSLPMTSIVLHAYRPDKAADTRKSPRRTQNTRKSRSRKARITYNRFTRKSVYA